MSRQASKTWILLCLIPPALALLTAVSLLGAGQGRSHWSMLILSTHALILASAFAVWQRLHAKGSHDLGIMVPAHLELALRSLAEAAFMIDAHGRVLFANDALVRALDRPEEQLIGCKVGELPFWDLDRKGADGTPFRGIWFDVLKDGEPRRGQRVGVQGDRSKSFIVHVTPMRAASGRSQGVWVGLEDVTKLQQKKAELSSLLETLRQSATQIRRQNLELEQLATRDALTGVFNRRSFFEFFENYFSDARRHGRSLACIMTDVDLFRGINLEYGHAIGDALLQQVARCLEETVRGTDIVCRYGGEEFVILLPRTTLTEATAVAEAIRQAVGRMPSPVQALTVSCGVSSTDESPGNPQELLDQTDLALSFAKNHGRNQTVRFDQLPDDVNNDAPAVFQTSHEAAPSIPFPAVTALISALASRDVRTASHSRRVADLCVAIGQRVMSLSSCYVLEMAALLHDIGKIGVPDAILLKPAAFNDDEWTAMRTHDRVGLEIIRASFGSPTLSSIVENYSRRYDESLASASPLPLGARILAVADAYDSMVSDQVYRPGIAPDDAIAELQRCAGTQFDPEIVSQFVEILLSHGFDDSLRLEVARETALALGMELERLAVAVDHQDLESLAVLAGRLSHAAAENGAPEIAAKAMELEAATSSDEDLLGILRCANELIAYCRATQTSYLESRIDRSRSAASKGAVTSLS